MNADILILIKKKENVILYVMHQMNLLFVNLGVLMEYAQMKKVKQIIKK